jgi:hypothetical protein
MNTVIIGFVVALIGTIFLVGTKRFVLGILGAYQRFNVLRLRLAGRTPGDEAQRRVVSGEAWADFCDTLKSAGAAVLAAGAPEDALSQAEGYRYLSRLARVGLESFVECADPCAPKLVALANGSRDARVCIGADSPDNLYLNGTISSEYSYRLIGQRGTVHYLGLSTNAGSYGKPGGLSTVCYKEVNEFEIGADGSLDVLICTKENRPSTMRGNWLELLADPLPHQVIVRQTFLNRDKEQPAALRLERVGQPTMPAPASPERLIAGLETTGLFVAGASMMFARWAAEVRSAGRVIPATAAASTDLELILLCNPDVWYCVRCNSCVPLRTRFLCSRWSDRTKWEVIQIFVTTTATGGKLVSSSDCAFR